MVALNQFNGLSKGEAVGLLAPYVAIPTQGETPVNLRPFANHHTLLQIAREAMNYQGENELNAALSTYPRIGEKPTDDQAHAVLPRQEQLAVDSESERLIQAPQKGSARYRTRFGRVFLIRAKGRGGEAILQMLTRRLQYTAGEEMTKALAQLREITTLRLEGVVGE